MNLKMKGRPTAGIPFSLFNGVSSYSLRLDILESVNIRKGEEVFAIFGTVRLVSATALVSKGLGFVSQ